jgi:hypothetical protein
MKKLFSVLLCGLLLLTTVGCGSSKTLEGKWQRKDSGTLNGTIVEVKKTNDGYQATISELSDDAKKAGYNVGDVKWKDVKELSKSSWEFKDQGRKADKSATWYDMNIEFDKDSKDKLIAKDVASNGESGSAQTWERVK